MCPSKEMALECKTLRTATAHTSVEMTFYI